MRAFVYGDRVDLADELRDEHIPLAREAAREGGRMLTEEVRRLLSLRQGDRSTFAPEGEPPEKDTGAVLASVKQLATRVKGNLASSGVLVNHPGAARLEWGATDVRGVRTFAHPYLRKAMGNMEGPINAMLARLFGGDDIVIRNDADAL